MERNPRAIRMMLTGYADMPALIAAINEGRIWRYLPKPWEPDDLRIAVKRGLEVFELSNENAQLADALAEANDRLRAENVYLRREVEARYSFEGIIGDAPVMQKIFDVTEKVAQTDATVLLTGETGTGKDLIARAIHYTGPRHEKKFVAQNCGALPETLLESELFGHEKGAFTGAAQRREGRFQQADGGTLFLDEIGDMPPEAQTRLLRVLANGEFYLVGGHTPVQVDVRIIAATHQNLEQLVAENRFREDLFHRLNVIRVHLPKLADRREDIPRLMQYFLQRAASELDAEPKTLSPEAEQFLCMLPWAGNVRQLENACRWLTVMASGREVHLGDLPPELKDSPVEKTTNSGNWEQQLRSWADGELATGKQDILTTAVPAFERALIETALSHTNGRKRDAAELLGWGRNTLTRKLKELGMSDEEEK